MQHEERSDAPVALPASPERRRSSDCARRSGMALLVQNGWHSPGTVLRWDMALPCYSLP